MAGRTTPSSEPLDASSFHIAIVAGRFHDDVTTRLVEGAVGCLQKHGAREVPVVWVPGAFELPLACAALAATSDAVVALGCVVRGDTPHFDYVCSAASRGIMDVMLATGRPIGFGLLTTEDKGQALARAGGADGNKGWDAAEAALEMATVLARLNADR